MSAAAAAVMLLLSIPSANAKHGVAHQVLDRRHAHHHHKKFHSPKAEGRGLAETEVIEKRSGQCQFPSDAGLVAVSPGSQNAGWAMSPDQPCKPGMYCPYACPPGQLMAQWDPSAVSYTYPQSMNGGLRCNQDGSIEKPFPDKPYCYPGKGSVVAVNNAGGNVAFCQTCLPGNEAMLIPTNVISSTTLAVPGTEYWAGTAAHYYINGPGISTADACIWGTNANPVGNWSPYVAGANTDASGQTFVKLGWNPIYLEPTTPFRNQMPNWGVKIECQGGGCNGLPCEIDPSKNKVNECVGCSTQGAGGGAFCVVTVPSGSKANIIVTGPGGSSSPNSDSAPPNSPQPPPPPPSTPSTPSTTPASIPTTPTPTKPLTVKKSSYPQTPTFTYQPHVFVENVTATTVPGTGISTGTVIKPSTTNGYTNMTATTPPKTGDAHRVFNPVIGATIMMAVLAAAVMV
ncbi:MAG: hypothetical protein M1840_007780 [Geoglossum simile]|nr:MAG: hypothetical protein M1840_007780 [Geoglossum simile]